MALTTPCGMCGTPVQAGVPACPACGMPLAEAPREDVRVPDVVGEIIAFRAWYIARTGKVVRLKSLMGVGGPTIWPRRRWLEAQCSWADVRHRRWERNDEIDDLAYQVPVEHCSCGIYAARTREHLVTLGYNQYHQEANRVIGEVALAGKVIVASQGWRAQKARPVKLYVPHEAWHLRDVIEKTYNVPVELTNVFHE